MNPRETRRKVLIKARMRTASAWSDACILNISSQGLLLSVAAPLPRGTYIELHRGSHVIIGRVAWTKHHRLGVRAQDRLAIDDIIDQPNCGGSPAPATPALGFPDRRSYRRPSNRTHEQNRWRSQAAQFFVVVAFGALAAVMTFQTIGQAFAGAIADVETAL